jgi:hypothetical protein
VRSVKVRRDYRKQAEEFIKDDRRRLRRRLKVKMWGERWSLREVAEETGLHKSSLSFFASGRRPTLSAIGSVVLRLWLDAQDEYDAHVTVIKNPPAGWTAS